MCKLLTASLTESTRVTPPGEWLLDDFYLIEEQIRTANATCRFSGYASCCAAPRTGRLAGRPRVYDIAIEIISYATAASTSKSLLASSPPTRTATTRPATAWGHPRSRCAWR